MLIPLFTIRDVQLDNYGKIFAFQNEEMAKRAFLTSLVQNNQDNMSNFPADFVLYAIGVYNDESGIITSQDPIRVCTGPEILAKREADVQRISELHQEINAINGEDHHV